MPAYPKIWTSLLHDKWYESLNLSSRGVWYQLIMLAKCGENSKIFSRNWTTLGSKLGCDGKTARKILGKFHEDGKITLKVLDSEPIEVDLLNYDTYQEVKTGKQVIEVGQSQGKFSENSPLNKEERKEIKVVEEQKPDYDPDVIIKTKKIEYDKTKTPYENLIIWDSTKEADDMADAFKAMPGYEEDWVQQVWTYEFTPHVKINGEEVFESLFNNHNGSWKKMFWSWLRRAKTGASYREYMKGRIK